MRRISIGLCVFSLLVTSACKNLEEMSESRADDIAVSDLLVAEGRPCTIKILDLFPEVLGRPWYVTLDNCNSPPDQPGDHFCFPQTGGSGPPLCRCGTKECVSQAGTNAEGRKIGILFGFHGACKPTSSPDHKTYLGGTSGFPNNSESNPRADTLWKALNLLRTGIWHQARLLTADNWDIIKSNLPACF